MKTITKEQALASIDALAETSFRIPPEEHRKLLTAYVAQQDEFNRAFLALEVDSAVEKMLYEPIEVYTDPDGEDGAPDTWADKPFCRVQFATDRGDSDVGIGPTSGHYLSKDQAGTVLERLIKLATWLDNNTTFVAAENTPSIALASVSKRIWFHATDDVDSYPFTAMVDKALDD